MVTLRSERQELKGMEDQVNVCKICKQQSQRVTMNCAVCFERFHLGCLTPPLRRRPQLIDAWKCIDCNKETKGDDNKAVNNRKNKRNEIVEYVIEQRIQVIPKRRCVTTRSKQKEEKREARQETNSMPFVCQYRKAAMKKKAKLLPTNGRTACLTSSRKVAVEFSDDEDEDDDDNDNDSDYVGESLSEEEEDDEEENNVTRVISNDEKQKLYRKRPAVKKSPAKQKSRVNRRVKEETATSPHIAANDNAHISDADSLDIEIVGEDESLEDVDVYDGPHYFIEYAANSRAKCKSCEQKLLVKQLRVGVNIRHSMFGDTTYYKHLECTAIGLLAGIETKQSKENSDTNDIVETSTQKKHDDPIDGLSLLQCAEQKLVLEYMERNDINGVIDERVPLADDHFNKKGRMPEKQPSKYLTATLLPYQREALAWMVGQEESDYKGGILADEMGMGKTIQAIALILENPREEDLSSKGKAVRDRKAAIARGGTLVVCPLVAVMQWKSEIERFVEPGHLSVYIHHGPKRLDLAAKIASYDIVLTTYSIIENEIRKTIGWSKVASKKKPKKRAAGETSEEEEEEEDDDVKKSIQKPKSRVNWRSKNQNDDKKSTFPKEKGKSPLHHIQWTRIVLDEAHYIKDRNCNTARGVFELQSNYRWCLSGTPLQNRIGELFSLVRFIRVKRYAYYHCNMCDCQMLDYNFPDKKCVQCSHSAIQHYSFFNKKVVIPIQSYGYVAEGKLAMQRLQNDVLQHILLRRTKEGRADDISLPPKLIRIRKDCLDERENDFYEAIYTQSQAQFNTYVSSGTLLNNYAHVFDLLIRLRQAVDHPYLVIYSKSNPALQLPNSAVPLTEEQPFGTSGGCSSEDERLCAICHECVEDGVIAKCGHEFCRECVREYIESLPSGGEATCPTCSKRLTVDLSLVVEETDTTDAPNERTRWLSSRSRKAVNLSSFHRNSILHRISDIHAFQSSTKIEALMQELELMRVRDPSGKAIIFSQFVNMLDIIHHRLQLGGVNCVKLSGNMSMSVRDRTIKAFRDDPTVTAFLISLKAGGVALNLTIASHIFLMDPWWNPAAENQAIDRTHRLGQFKPIQATRFIIAGTVEERILKLQEKKRLIFEGTVGANVSAICRLTEEDLRFLFAS
ncbi:unnamed protein product [Peronospora belbahrii]|uniref:Uncharacterized protein n=1 Tax=Peronospora belbahrii TaxID=622444 RepID=A0AAU9L8W6_9STRA|nr:unnamed protein product [Peronospora belbahrii]